MDYTVLGIAKSQTGLSNFNFTSCEMMDVLMMDMMLIALIMVIISQCMHI